MFVRQWGVDRLCGALAYVTKDVGMGQIAGATGLLLVLVVLALMRRFGTSDSSRAWMSEAVTANPLREAAEAVCARPGSQSALWRTPPLVSFALVKVSEQKQ